MTKLYLTMPQPGETITEGTIVEWTVEPGVEIAEGQVVAQLETEKAVFEYESPFDGKLLDILHPAGTRTKVAEPIAVMDVDDEKAKIYQMMGIGKVAEGDAGVTPALPANKAPESLPAHQQAKELPAALNVDLSSIKMSPYVRKLALHHGVSEESLKKIASQSPESRITKAALESFVGSGEVAEVKPVVTMPTKSTKGSRDMEFEAKPCSAIRMRIADNMVLSKTKIPHAHNGISVDITKVVQFRNQYKSRFKEKFGDNLNLLSLIYPALVRAIEKHPEINASYDDTTTPHQIKYFKRIHLGVAAGTEHGLVIPVVHDLKSLSFLDFNRALNEKLKKAASKKLMPDDLMGATLIFNNYGFFGTNLGVQVIQYPMACTLGMSAIEQRVVPLGEGTIGIRTMCDFVLSFDHRVMDGRETGMFLKALKDGIEGLDFSHVSVL